MSVYNEILDYSSEKSDLSIDNEISRNKEVDLSELFSGLSSVAAIIDRLLENIKL